MRNASRRDVLRCAQGLLLLLLVSGQVRAAGPDEASLQYYPTVERVRKDVEAERRDGRPGEVEGRISGQYLLLAEVLESSWGGRHGPASFDVQAPEKAKRLRDQYLDASAESRNHRFPALQSECSGRTVEEQEAKGIGTPATRAKIVDNLVERNYVVEAKEGKRKVYKSTPRGRALFAAVPDHLRKPDLTAYFEELLKAIERGEASLDKFVSQQLRFIDKLLTEIREGGVSARIPVIPQEDSAKTPARASRGNRSHTAPSRGNGAKGSSGSSANAFPI